MSINWPFETLEPGIYFDLPFDEYLDIKALQSSSIKNLDISPMDFWSRSWMNPWKGDYDDDTKAYADGRAYHMRILEGAEAFYNHYAAKYEYLGYQPDKLLYTGKDLSAELKKLKLPVSGAKPELINRLIKHDPKYKDIIFSYMEEQYLERIGCEEFLEAKTIREIELAAKMIECHPYLKSYFVGGYPEVTVVWDDEEFGVRMKIRVDYQKIGPPCDLKTFANQMRKRLDKCVADQFGKHKYFIQASLYMRGRDMASKLAAQGRVFNAGNVEPKWIKALSQTHNDEFWYIFQQKGIAPIAVGRELHRSEGLYATGINTIRDACETFKTNFAFYGEDPWIDRSKPKRIYTDDIPAYAYD